MRESKVHYIPNDIRNDRTQCGNSGRTTYTLDSVTCKICMFQYLADMAPWAREFLNGLRGEKATAAVRLIEQAERLERMFKLPPVNVPAPTPEPTYGVVERISSALGRPFYQQAGSQKAISELLPKTAPASGTVEPVMHNGGPAAQPVWIEPRQVSQDAWDAGKIRDESGGDF